MPGRNPIEFFPMKYWNKRSKDIIIKKIIFMFAHKSFFFPEIFLNKYKKITIRIGNLKYEIDLRNVSKSK